jgi:ABC-type transporter Mla subunit MlaD
MTETTQPTIAELAAQQAEIARQIAERSIPEVQAAIAALDGASADMATLSDVVGRLPEGLAKQVLSSVTYAYNQARQNITTALTNLQRDAAPIA